MARLSGRWGRLSVGAVMRAIVVTKFGMNYKDMPNLRDSSPTRVVASIDKSPKALGSDWVDIYLVHFPDHRTPFEETMSALEDIVLEGKVRFVGVSNFKHERDPDLHACTSNRRSSVRLEYV